MRRLSTLTLFWPLSRQEYSLLSPSSLSFLLNFIQDPPCGIIIKKKRGLLSRDIPAYLTLVHHATSTGGEDCKVANLFLFVSVLSVNLACELLVLLLATASTILSPCIRKVRNYILLPQKIRFFFQTNLVHMAIDGNPSPRRRGGRTFPKGNGIESLKSRGPMAPPERSIEYVLRDPLKESWTNDKEG